MKTKFYVYQNNKLKATFLMDNESTEEDILEYFDKAKMLFGNDIKIRLSTVEK